MQENITFEEAAFYDDRFTIYFTAPLSVLPKEYGDAEFATIAMEFPMEHPCDPEYATVTVAPTRYSKEDDGYEDYDHAEVELPWDEIESLLDVYAAHIKERGCDDAAL